MLRTARDVALLLPVKGFPMEVLGVYYLTDSNELLGADYSYGTAAGVSFDVGDIVSRARARRARRIVFAHSHPASSIDLSTGDLEAAVRVRRRLDSEGLELYGYFVTDGNDARGATFY